MFFALLSFLNLQKRDYSPKQIKELAKKVKPEKGRDFTSADENSTDDETTMAEQEAHENAIANHIDNDNGGEGPSALEAKEVAALEAEADMSIQELLARYGIKSGALGAPKTEEDEQEGNVDQSEKTNSSTSGDSSDGSASSSDGEDENNVTDDETTKELGLEELLEEDEREKLETKKETPASPVSLVLPFSTFNTEGMSMAWPVESKWVRRHTLI